MTEILTHILEAVIAALGAIAAAAITSILTPSLGQKNGDGDTGPKPPRSFRWLEVSFVVIGFAALVGVVGFIAYILLQPTPRAQIIKPEDYNRQTTVPTQTNVVVKYDDIPGDRYVWVVVRTPSVRPMRLAYPQLMNGLPTPVTGSGTFQTSVDLGGSADSGIPFNIEVLLLDQEANQAFITYSKNCIATGICPGIALPSPGVEVLDFVTVIRQ